MFRPISFLTTLLFLSLPAHGQSGFDTKAPHAVILDAATGEVLYEKEARQPIAPASMTKIMTADLVFDALRNGSLTPETKFRVSADAWRRGGVKSGSSTMFLKEKSQVSVGDLLMGVIAVSYTHLTLPTTPYV